MRSIIVRVLKKLKMYGMATRLLAPLLVRLTSLTRRMFAPENEQVRFDSRSIHRGILTTTYRGIGACRCPFDYVIYQMIVYDLRPDLVIEIGTGIGGGALYLADLMNNIGHGIVHTIDVESKAAEIVREHPRIRLFTEGWERYDIAEAQPYGKILVIDDGSHVYEQTLGAMHKFAPLVSVGSYLIVEDGMVSELGIPGEVDRPLNGGPLRAIREFLKSTSDFVVDRHWCDYYGRNATWNVNGYLKRIR